MRKQLSLNTPPHIEDFSNELNFYEDEDNVEEYEGVEGDELDATEAEEDTEDGASLLAERLGSVLRSNVDSPSPDAEDAKLLDLLQLRLFVAPKDRDEDRDEAQDEVEAEVEIKAIQLRKSSVARRSTTSLEAFMSSDKQLTSTLDQDAQRLLLDTFSREQDRPLSLSPEKVAQMTTRFRIFEEKKAHKLKAKRRETEENVKFRYTPTMNRKSRELTSQIPTFAERQAALLAKRRQQRVRLEQRREQELTRDRTHDLQESVKTPCICSHGNTSRSENCVMSAEREPSPSKVAPTTSEGANSPVDSVRHSQACMRFMAMCSKMNSSFAIQRKKELMRRSIDDIIAYQEGKKQRQQARAAIAKAKEDKETTFTPQINTKSEKIYAALMRSGKLDMEMAGRMFKPRKTPPLPPKMTFQPTISKKSKWLLKKKQRELVANSAHDADADANATRPTSPLHLDVFSRLQQLSSHRETEAYRLQRLREEEGLRNKPPVEWNVIQYDSVRCDFILQGFDLPNFLS